jgi:hypothetical protein
VSVRDVNPQGRTKREISCQFYGKYTYLYITSFTGYEHRGDLQRFKARLLTPYQTIPSGKCPLGVKLS